MFVYLAPYGQIASFRADEIPVLPVIEEKGKPPKTYRGGLKSGTCIKVYDYAWPQRSMATTNGREELEKYLYSLALPIRISETRDYTAHYHQATLCGVAVNISDQKYDGPRVEEGFSQLPLQITRPEIGELKVAVTVFRDKDDNGKPFRTTRIPHGVVFTVNGQVHHREAADFIEERLGYASLDKHMLVAVDCTNMLPTAHAGFFTTSRDRTVDANYRKIIIDELIHHLAKEDSPLRSALRKLNARRRQETLKDTLNDDEPAKVLQDLVRAEPALAAIFSPGTRIHDPHVPEDDNTEPFFGKRFPTFFRLSHEPEGGLVKSCPINRTCRIRFETDAENGYFGRAEDPGSITFQPQGINRAWNLRNGVVGATFVMPPNARVGDVIPVEVRVTDDTQAEPFVCQLRIRVTEAAPDPGPREPGPQPPRGASRLAMPNVIPVTRDGRVIDGKRTVQWDNKNNFNEFTALKISPSGEDEGKYDIFVNMDNIHLANALHRERRTSEHPLITYHFKYGLTLVALGMLQEHKRHEKKEGGTGTNGRPHSREASDREEEHGSQNGDDKGYLARINSACIGIAAVIIPVIQRLSHGPAQVPAEA
jgi:hypothetical protein